MKERSEIKFIRPCLYKNEERRALSQAYTLQCLKHQKVVQINLGNCSLQRMEELSSTSTLEDVERVGLLPLVNLLQSGEVCLTAIGVNEMPDLWVEKSMAAYQNFCHRFWPGHIDDPEATFREYDPRSEKRKLSLRSFQMKQEQSMVSITFQCCRFKTLNLTMHPTHQNKNLKYIFIV